MGDVQHFGSFQRNLLKDQQIEPSISPANAHALLVSDLVFEIDEICIQVLLMDDRPNLHVLHDVE